MMQHLFSHLLFQIVRLAFTMFIDSESFVSHRFCPGLIAKLTQRCDLHKCLSRAGAHSKLILALDYYHTAN